MTRIDSRVWEEKKEEDDENKGEERQMVQKGIY